MKRDLIIITVLALMIVGCIVTTALIYLSTIEDPQPKTPVELYNFGAAEDWYLDSTMTEKRHIFYETQFKMR